MEAGMARTLRRLAIGLIGSAWLGVAGCQDEADTPGTAAVVQPAVGDASLPTAVADAGAAQTASGVDASRPSETADAGTATAPSRSDASVAASPQDAAAPSMLDASTRDAAAAVTADGGQDFNALAQQCVDTINKYRATLGLAALRRATPEQEACSDVGAKKDGESMMAHSSAASCKGMNAQNTCPGWGFGPRTGNATLSAALDKCLQMMWEEGEPPVPLSECLKDYQGCFLKHGHYINMSSKDSKVVSCGFFDMGKNTFWMNQDFGR
jgi:hypothetical protein